jgi:hypothetical protein
LQLSKPVYESLPWGYALGGAALITISHRLHSGLVSSVLLLSGVLAVVGGAAIWLRRRDFRATSAEYWSHDGQPDVEADDARRSPEKP